MGDCSYSRHIHSGDPWEHSYGLNGWLCTSQFLGNLGRRDSELAKQCPKCKLTNPSTAVRCDCGYDFEDQVVKQSYLVRSEPNLGVREFLHIGSSGSNPNLVNIIWDCVKWLSIQALWFVLPFGLIWLVAWLMALHSGGG